MNISATSVPIATKFYVKHHWGGGKAALGFGLDRIRSLVFMATDSSHRVIIGENVVNTFIFDRIFIQKSSKFGQNMDCRVSCPGLSGIIPIDL